VGCSSMMKMLLLDYLVRWAAGKSSQILSVYTAHRGKSLNQRRLLTYLIQYSLAVHKIARDRVEVSRKERNLTIWRSCIWNCG
jgi:hypothetical protein